MCEFWYFRSGAAEDSVTLSGHNCKVDISRVHTPSSQRNMHILRKLFLNKHAMGNKPKIDSNFPRREIFSFCLFYVLLIKFK